jgi:hypothetical protein
MSKEDSWPLIATRPKPGVATSNSKKPFDSSFGGAGTRKDAPRPLLQPRKPPPAVRDDRYELFDSMLRPIQQASLLTWFRCSLLLLPFRESLAHELAKLSGQPVKSVEQPVASSEAVSKLLMKVQEDNYLDVDKLNAKLRKEFDAAKAANKTKMKELQRVTAELSHVERMVQSDRAEGGSTSRDKGVQELDVKIEAVQQQCQVR